MTITARCLSICLLYTLVLTKPWAWVKCQPTSTITFNSITFSSILCQHGNIVQCLMSTSTICSKAKHMAPKIDEYIIVFPPQSAPFLCETRNPLQDLHSPLKSCLNYCCRCRPLTTIISATNNECYDNGAMIIVIITDQIIFPFRYQY